MKNIITLIEDGNKSIVEMEREVLELMTKANKGGFFTEAEKLAGVYKHIAAARKDVSRALVACSFLYKEVGNV